MKKILAGLVLAAVFAGVAYAAEEATYSKNAVGFINVEAKGGQLYALTVPFDNMAEGSEGLWDFEETQLAQDAEFGSTVYFWDGITWQEFNKGPLGFGIDEEYEMLEPGQCFFFQPSEDMTITMAGQVPMAAKRAVPVVGKENLSAIGNPYPTDMLFEDTELAKNAEFGSTLYIWDGNTWLEYNKGPLGFGIDEEYETIKPGTGFFFQTTEDDESADWNVEKGYEWP